VVVDRLLSAQATAAILLFWVVMAVTQVRCLSPWATVGTARLTVTVVMADLWPRWLAAAATGVG
jgi:hypothetical protein